MTSDKPETTIAAVRLDDEYSFPNENPLGGEVVVNARGGNGNEQIFVVETTDGYFRPNLDCHIVAHPSGKHVTQSDVPEFDLNAIVDAAEDVMDANLELEDTGQRSRDGNKLFLAINPDTVHIVEENKATNDSQSSQARQLFGDALWSCNTAEEARDYVEQHFGPENDTMLELN